MLKAMLHLCIAKKSQIFVPGFQCQWLWAFLNAAKRQKMHCYLQNFKLQKVYCQLQATKLFGTDQHCTGYSTEALELLEKFSTARLLGNHIPYAVEAFPEGNQAQLSAESGLYLRIFTEGILGIRPTGFGKFQITPNLPKTWDCMECNNIKFAGKTINIKVTRKKSGYTLQIAHNDTILDFEGKNFEIQL